MGGAVLIGALQLQHDLAGTITLEPFVGDRRAGNVATQVFEFPALIGAATHTRVQALVPCSGEAVRVGAQGLAGWHWSAWQRLQAEHFVPGSRPKCDAVGARGGLQRRERVIGIRVGQVGHPLLLDEGALAGQQLQDARDDLRE